MRFGTEFTLLTVMSMWLYIRTCLNVRFNFRNFVHLFCMIACSGISIQYTDPSPVLVYKHTYLALGKVSWTNILSNEYREFHTIFCLWPKNRLFLYICNKRLIINVYIVYLICFLLWHTKSEPLNCFIPFRSAASIKCVENIFQSSVVSLFVNLQRAVDFSAICSDQIFQ